jgi:glutamate-1-semialdehyde 2,1-aminomutase
VKTGATPAYGGAVESFGVVPDAICLAKAIGGGTPCASAPRRTSTGRDPRRVRHGRHLQREPAHDGRLAAPDRGSSSRPTRHFNGIDKVMKDGLNAIVEKYELPCYVTGLGAMAAI